MATPGQRIGVCFGGPSVEHDVSIISAEQLMAALAERHEPVPIYLARDGRFWTGEALRKVEAFGDGDVPKGAEPCELRLGRADGAGFVVPSASRMRGDRFLRLDAVINAIHGTGGEDGALLGALDHTEIPYAGGGVGPAAAAMNKATAKAVFRAAGIEVNPDLVIDRGEHARDPGAALSRAREEVGLPCFVKPISLGSSIGVSRCAEDAELEEALELGFELDRAVLVEPALDDAVEINCAVLGRPDGELRASLCEQPVKGEAMLGFEEKYMSGGGKGGGSKGGEASAGGAKGEGEGGGMASQDRLIPAPIPEALTTAIQETAVRAQRALGFAGVSRYDFLVTDPEGQARIVLNEANTVPGSFSFYLFEPQGLSFPDLAEALIEIAVAEAAERRATTRSFDSILLETYVAGQGGPK
jgi:D-alanine-D-alanine ligase